MVYTFEKLNHSIRGSYLTVKPCPEGLAVITARKWDDLGVHEVFRILPGEPIRASFDEAQLWAEGASVRFSLCLEGMDHLRLRGAGSLTLTQRDYPDIYIANMVFSHSGGVCFPNYPNNSFTRVTPLRGVLEVDAPKTQGEVKHDHIHLHILPDENGEFEVFVEQFPSPSFYDTCPGSSFDACVVRNRADYLAWEAPFCCESDADREAVYVMWSNICSKDANFLEDAMLMSKSGMIAVWSWDNCINALGLAKAHPEFALSQFLLPYRYMDTFGCTPDAIYEWRCERVFVKPPIQGWIYRKLVLSNSFFAQPETVAQIYPLMKKNTLWWLKFRGDRPYYLHGNDSGADNATCFDACQQITTGELAAMLSVQCSVLADMADSMGLPEENRQFTDLAQQLLRTSVEDFFDGRLFVRRMDTGDPVYSQALMPYRMIVLEQLLPDTLKAHILRQLKAHYITPYGISSEPVSSPQFEEDGYWRGAVWPPDQVVFLLSLAQCAEDTLARQVAADYRSCLRRNGFYENLSALTGKGLRCTGYTWSASAYFALKNLL